MAGFSLTPERVAAQLRTVMDPETHINIVEMGFIRDIQVTPLENSWQVRVLYTLTTPGCPLAGRIQYDIQRVIAEIVPQEILQAKTFQPEKDIVTELTFDPPWSLQDMSEEARAELGF